MLGMFKHEVWEFEVVDEFHYDEYGMSGELYREEIPEGATGVARVYKDGKIKVEFDSLNNPLRVKEQLSFRIPEEEKDKIKLTTKVK